jgi:hypothetical protein
MAENRAPFALMRGCGATTGALIFFSGSACRLASRPKPERASRHPVPGSEWSSRSSTRTRYCYRSRIAAGQGNGPWNPAGEIAAKQATCRRSDRLPLEFRTRWPSLARRSAPRRRTSPERDEDFSLLVPRSSTAQSTQDYRLERAMPTAEGRNLGLLLRAAVTGSVSA